MRARIVALSRRNSYENKSKPHVHRPLPPVKVHSQAPPKVVAHANWLDQSRSSKPLSEVIKDSLT